jgi:hypothetical protein
MEGKFGVKRGEHHLASLDTLIASVVMCLYVKGKIVRRVMLEQGEPHPEYNPVSIHDLDRPIIGSCQNPINTWWDVGQTLRRA